MRKSFLPLFFLLSISSIVSSSVAAQIEGQTAHKLGLIALKGTPDESGALDSTFDTPDDDGFYVAQGWSEHGTFGWFAVNSWTGDVWDLGSSNCKQLNNPALREEQRKIKKRFKDKKVYRRLHNLKPRRMYDLEYCGSPP